MKMYVNILVFSMFKTNRFISFWKLYQQRHFAQLVSDLILYDIFSLIIHILKFLSPFVNWGIISLRLLSSMPNNFPLSYNDVASQATSHLTMKVLQGWDCNFDFLDEEFMDIIHDRYIDFLVPKMFKFASGEDGTEWELVYVTYVKAVISHVDEWVADHEHIHILKVEHNKHLTMAQTLLKPKVKKIKIETSTNRSRSRSAATSKNTSAETKILKAFILATDFSTMVTTTLLESVRATVGSEAEASRKYKYSRMSQLTPKTDRMSKEINNQSN